MRFPSLPELDFFAAGGQPGRRTTNQGAQGCGVGAKSKVGGDQDSIDAQGFESAFKTAKQKQVKAIMTTALPSLPQKESGSSSLPPNTGCRLFIEARSPSMREVSCPMGRRH